MASALACRSKRVIRPDVGRIAPVWNGGNQWHGEWQAGLEFERPMHVAVFDHVAAQMKQADGRGS
jgi:hypothetical protein